MMAFISLNLFLLNLFPIPVLDGGHLVLFAIEAIRRKPLSIKIIDVWTTTGFFLLMGLVAIVFFNDLARLGIFSRWSS
jgi:regulator of sigma E protease